MRFAFWRRPAPQPQKAARLSASPKGRAVAGTAGLIAVAVSLAIPLTGVSEGLKNRPYWDPARIRTTCYGETENVQERFYSTEECRLLLRDRMTKDYAPKVLACLPQLRDERRRHAFAALIDAAYNAGPAAVCKSRMAVRIRAGDWRGACNGFEGWYTTAKNRKTGVRKELPGLVKRRLAEKALCQKSL